MLEVISHNELKFFDTGGVNGAFVGNSMFIDLNTVVEMIKGNADAWTIGISGNFVPRFKD